MGQVTHYFDLFYSFIIILVDRIPGRLGIRRIKKGGSFERNHRRSWGERHCRGKPFHHDAGPKRMITKKCLVNSQKTVLFFVVVQGKLGKWSFKSKTHDTFYEGYMFPLLVQEQLEFWPEQNVRQRIWVRKKMNKIE